MSKNLLAKTLVVFFCCGGISQAHPLDSPDIVYIDGLPCNTACQSYMKWSRQQMSPAATPAQHATSRTSVKRRQASEKLRPIGVAGQAARMPPTREAEPAGKQEANSERAHENATASTVSDSGAAARTRPLREQVAAATALAEQVTKAAARPDPSQGVNPADLAKGAQPGNTEQGRTISGRDDMVALVMARPDIKSVADLAGKDVAIDEAQTVSSADVRTAIAAAGAAEVQLSAGQTKAIDRLVAGEVPAAVLTLVSKEAGEWFPEIAGFRVFRVPLSPDH